MQKKNKQDLRFRTHYTQRMGAALFVLAISLLTLNACSDGVEPGLPIVNGIDTTTHEFQWTLFPLENDSSSSITIAGMHIESDGELRIYGEFRRRVNGINTSYNIASISNETVNVQQVVINPTMNSQQIVAAAAFPDGSAWITHGYNFTYFDDSQNIIRTSNLSASNPIALQGWGSSWKNAYFACRTGKVFYFNGAGWRQIDLGEQWDAWAIDGSNDTAIVAQTHPQLEAVRYYRIVGGVLEHLPNDTISGFNGRKIFSVDADDFYVAGGYVRHYRHGTWEYAYDASRVEGASALSVAGSRWNDLVVGGHYCSLLHYNGSTWKQISPYFMRMGYIFDIVVGDDIIWAVIRGLENKYWVARGVRTG